MLYEFPSFDEQVRLYKCGESFVVKVVPGKGDKFEIRPGYVADIRAKYNGRNMKMIVKLEKREDFYEVEI